MTFPIFHTPARSEREKLDRLMQRRDALPFHLRCFPEPPRYLSKRELAAYEDLRCAFNATGAVGTDQAAVIEALAVGIVRADRLREALKRTPLHEWAARGALIRTLKTAEDSVQRTIDFIGPTKAMRVWLVSRSRGALNARRVGLEDRRRHARPTA